MAYLTTSIPTQTAYLDTSFLNDSLPRTTGEWIPVEIFSVVSISRRCLLFNVMSEFGAQFARVPIHYLSKTFEPQTNFELHWIQLWDCFSYYFSVHRFDYLKNASAYMLLKDKSKHVAKYAFTIDWCNGEDYNLGYSEISSGHKCAHIFWGEGGQMFAQPNNRIVWRDSGAFIGSALPPESKTWRPFSQEFSCEGLAHKWTAGDEELVYYEFKVQPELAK
jgi:hypothetical protein